VTQADAVGNGAARETAAELGRGKRRWWNRASTLWLIAAVVILPFGWILPVVQLAWVRAKALRTKGLDASPDHGTRH
jgi:hypothetical protein